MKLVLDLPSVALGLVAGLLLASGPSLPGWLFDYTGVPLLGVGICVAFLAGTAGWLLLFPPPLFRAVSFTPVTRPDAFAGETPALKPMDWLRKQGLADRGAGKVDIDRVKTAAAFAAQLGEPRFDWGSRPFRDTLAGLKDMPVHVQALAVAFNLSRRRDPRAENVKQALNVVCAFHTGEVAEKKVAELIAPYLADGKFVAEIEAVVDRHAFVNTAVMGLFAEAKMRGGPLACAEFLWLKRVDRTLWYALQNVGRNAWFIEGAGCHSHYFAETKGGRGNAEPQVAAAVQSLEDYLVKHGLTGPSGSGPSASPSGPGPAGPDDTPKAADSVASDGSADDKPAESVS